MAGMPSAAYVACRFSPGLGRVVDLYAQIGLWPTPRGGFVGFVTRLDVLFTVVYITSVRRARP